MKTYRTLKRFLEMGAFLMTFMVVASLSRASDRTLSLSPDKAGKGASGEVVIKDTDKDQKEIAITVKGLKPEGVYTVWFMTMKPKMYMAGIGSPDYIIKIGSKGNGTYRAAVSAAELEKWQVIEIAYHKSGNPKDMKNIAGALAVQLAPLAKGSGM
jgi:hypothetical protein